MKYGIIAFLAALLAVFCASTALAASFELDGLTWTATPAEAEAWLGEGVRRSKTDGTIMLGKDKVECLGFSGASACFIFTDGQTNCFYFLFPDNSAASEATLIQALTDRFGAPDGEDALPYSVFDMVSLMGGVEQTRLCAWTTDDDISVDLYELIGNDSEDSVVLYRYVVSFTSDIDLMNSFG